MSSFLILLGLAFLHLCFAHSPGLLSLIEKWSWGQELRFALQNISTYLPYRYLGMFRALTTGEGYLIDELHRQMLRESSIYHLFVISGFHFNLISRMVLACLHSIPLFAYALVPSSYRWLQGVLNLLRAAQIPLLWVLLELFAYSIPAQRSAICICASLLLKVFGLRQAWIRKLSWMLMVHMILSPGDFFSRSSLLSWFCYIVVSFPMDFDKTIQLCVRQTLFFLVPVIFFGQVYMSGIVLGFLSGYLGMGLFLWVGLCMCLVYWPHSIFESAVELPFERFWQGIEAVVDLNRSFEQAFMASSYFDNVRTMLLFSMIAGFLVQGFREIRSDRPLRR